MQRTVRIAVVGPVDDQLVGALRALPLAPEVRLLHSLHGDTEALLRFEPHLLVAALGDAPAEVIGALRLLRNLWPEIAIVIATEVAGEIDAAPLASRIGASMLVQPCGQGQLAGIVEQALHGGDRPPAEVFLDLAHGMADEINNPLLFVSGHLQLLHSGLDPSTEKTRRDQVRAALDGVQRIQRSVDRLRLLSLSSEGPKHEGPVDLAVLVRAALAGRPDAEATVAAVTVADEDLSIRGDKDQLGPATEAIVRFADALADAGIDAKVGLETLEAAVRLRLTLRGTSLTQWRLPQTFEPFYPSRMLRGHGHGLALFLAQTVVHGHHGQATVRRLGEGLEIDFVLPRRTQNT